MGIITKLKKLGCKVVRRKTTEVAMNWWLSVPPSLEKINILDATEFGSYQAGGQTEFYSRICHLSFQTEMKDGHEGIFVAKYRRTQSGRDYLRGIDC